MGVLLLVSLLSFFVPWEAQTYRVTPRVAEAEVHTISKAMSKPEVANRISSRTASDVAVEKGRMQVTIIGATGYIESESYCICQLQQRPETIFQTEEIKDSWERSWNYAKVIDGCGAADVLEFRVFEQHLDGSEHLGTAVLAGVDFHPNGFDGWLDIWGKIVHAKLHVKVEMVPSPAMRATQKWTPRQLMPPTVYSMEIAQQYYAHGAFMASAGELWNDPQWSVILEMLQPDVFADVAKVVARGGKKIMSTVIPMFENNPVIAAYGTLATRALDQVDREQGKSPTRLARMRGFEWDAFFDPDLVSAWRTAWRTAGVKDDISDQIVDTMLIAHGSGAQLAYELTLKHQYHNVKQNRMTEMGGAIASDWMDLFAKALVLGGTPNVEPLQRKYSFQEAVAVYRQTVGAIFQEVPFSVILDVKHVDTAGSYMPALLDDVIMSLNRRGIHVEAVGTFYFKAFPHLSGRLASTQVLELGDDMLQSTPVTRIKFFHFVGDLQEQMQNGKVQQGDSVMFNGCSLIDHAQTTGEWSYELNKVTLGGLAVYQRLLELKIGIYVQEGNIDAAAYALLAGAVNDYDEIFSLGFAWGGVNGHVSDGVKPTKSDKTGCGAQSLVGYQWDGYKADRTLLFAWLRARWAFFRAQSTKGQSSLRAASKWKRTVHAMKDALASASGLNAIKEWDLLGEDWHIHSKKTHKYPYISVQASLTSEGTNPAVQFTALLGKREAFTEKLTLSAILPGPLARKQ